MGYKARLLDDYLRDLISEVPAIELYGAKAVGKTSTAEQLVDNEIRLDTEAGLEIAKGGSPAIKALGCPLLIDEWQRYSAVWDIVRRLVDEDDFQACYLLTGSGVPSKAPVHSGAGRIVSLRMRPLSLQEREIEAPAVLLSELLSGSIERVAGKTSVALPEYLHEVVASGFPALHGLPQRSRNLRLDSYIKNLTTKEFAEQGVAVRKPAVLLAWLKAYAAATGSTASYATILRASSAGAGTQPSKEVTTAYRDTLDNLWVTDRLEPWLPTTNQFAALAIAPKHYLTDPALSARLLRLDEDALLKGSATPVLGMQEGAIAGRLFESLVALSLQTYATVNEVELKHFRTGKGDHEIDFIVEGDHAIVALEVKLSAGVDDSDVKHLNWLANKDLGKPLVRAVINSGDFAYTRADGTHVIPAALLGA